MAYINLCPHCRKTLISKDIYEEDDCGIDFVRTKTYYIGIEEICECGYKNLIDFSEQGDVEHGRAS